MLVALRNHSDLVGHHVRVDVARVLAIASGLRGILV